MNWEDTVMNSGQRGLVLAALGEDATHGNGLQRIAEKQAEITGDIAYKAGMKEVVKFLYKHGVSSLEYKGRLRLIQIAEDFWQAFLKEWGLHEGD